MKQFEIPKTVRLHTGEEVPIATLNLLKLELIKLFTEGPDLFKIIVDIARGAEIPINYSSLMHALRKTDLLHAIKDPIKRSIILAMARGKDYDFTLVDPITGEPIKVE